MNDSGQFTSDLRIVDKLSSVLDEFLSVSVIPVESETRAPIMAHVKVRVLLPLDREMFMLGTVILHRPDGFLVQLDTTPDTEFLRRTLRDATIADAKVAHGRQAGQASGTPPVMADVADQTRVNPASSQKDEPGAGHLRFDGLGRSTGRVQGKAPVADRVEITAPPPRPQGERPRPGTEESTRPGFQKPAAFPDDSRQERRRAGRDDQEDFTISSISAVDAVTGKPIRTQSQSIPKHEPRVDDEFTAKPGAHETAGGTRSGNIPGGDEGPGSGQETTRRFFAPDLLEKARAEVLHNPAVAAIVEGSDPVDELFSLAAEAGAIDIAESGLIDNAQLPEGTAPAFRRPTGVIPEARESTTPAFRRPAEVAPADRESTRPAFRMPDEVAQQPPPDRMQAPQPEPRDEAPRGTTELEPENRELAVSIREMSTVEKQKLARQGKRVARRILIRDNDKTIHKFVLFNPEVQLDEVIEYTRWNGLSTEAIEFITTNRKWMDSRDVIYNLVRNPSTPIEIAVRFLVRLSPGDWRLFAKPGVVRPAIQNQARKLLNESDKK